jgi:hypothetical protein
MPRLSTQQRQQLLQLHQQGLPATQIAQQIALLTSNSAKHHQQATQQLAQWQIGRDLDARARQRRQRTGVSLERVAGIGRSRREICELSRIRMRE